MSNDQSIPPDERAAMRAVTEAVCDACFRDLAVCRANPCPVLRELKRLRAEDAEREGKAFVASQPRDWKAPAPAPAKCAHAPCSRPSGVGEPFAALRCTECWRASAFMSTACTECLPSKESTPAAADAARCEVCGAVPARRER